MGFTSRFGFHHRSAFYLGTLFAFGVAGLAPRTGAEALPTVGAADASSINQAKPSDALTLTPNYADETSTRRPLMRLLDQHGMSKPLDDLGIDIYGFLQASYTVNLSDPHSDDALGSDPARHRIQGRMFDHHSNQLALNRFDVFIQRGVDYDAGKWDVGGLVEMQYGIDAAMMHSNGLFDYDETYTSHASPQYQFDLTQAYVDLAVPVANGLRIRAGKFTTLIGYESCDPTTRTSIQFYSRSWILTLGIPMYQTGVIATYDFNPKLTANLGITRGWEQSIEDNNAAVDLLGSVNYVISDQLTVFGGLSLGPQQPDDSSHWRTLLNGTIYYKPDPTGPWTFALDSIIAWEDNQVKAFYHTKALDDSTSPATPISYQQDNSVTPVGDTYWAGLAGFAAYRINPNLIAKGRAEWFYDADGTRWTFPEANRSFTAAPMSDPFVKVGRAYSAFEFTTGLDIVPFPSQTKDLLIRPEIRCDVANHNIFVNGDRSFQVTAAMDVLYKF